MAEGIARCGTCHPDALSDADRITVAAFKRFLSLVGPVGERRVPLGWKPYLFGLTEPPEGLDDVPLTAWTLPS